MWEVKIMRHPLTLCLSIYIMQRGQKTTSLLQAKDWEWVDLKDGEQYPEPTLKIDRCGGIFEKELLQALIEALSGQGVEPNEMLTLRAQVEAIKYHLEDMRKLVFKK